MVKYMITIAKIMLIIINKDNNEQYHLRIKKKRLNKNEYTLAQYLITNVIRQYIHARINEH